MKMTEAKVLIYHMEPGKCAKVAKIASDLGIFPVPVTAENENAPLGLMAGAKDWMNALLMQNTREDHDLTEEMMVMCGLSDKLLDKFLDKLKKEDARVSLKAILTAQNAVWNARQLQGELAGERAAVMKSLGK